MPIQNTRRLHAHKLNNKYPSVKQNEEQTKFLPNETENGGVIQPMKLNGWKTKTGTSQTETDKRTNQTDKVITANTETE